jgi:hypothetical protein
MLQAENDGGGIGSKTQKTEAKHLFSDWKSRKLKSFQ